MKVKTVIENIRRERKIFSRCISLVLDHDDMDKMVNAKWTAKDVLAHVLWYENEMVTLLRGKHMKSNYEIWNNTFDKRNELVYEVQKDKSLEELLELHKTVEDQVIAELEQVTDEQMLDSSWIDGMPPDWEPWNIIAGNTFRHYPDHVKSLKSAFDYL